MAKSSEKKEHYKLTESEIEKTDQPRCSVLLPILFARISDIFNRSTVPTPQLF